MHVLFANANWLAALHMRVLFADANLSELTSLDAGGQALYHWNPEWGVHLMEWHPVQF